MIGGIRHDMPTHRVALVLLALSVAILAGAYAFEIFGGLIPCELCHYQRAPYAVAILLCAMILLAPETARAGLALLVLCYAASAILGAYHAGIEWKWWPGPAACSAPGAPAASVEELLAQILAAPVVRCDEVPWSLLGISLAGYNALISLGLMSLILYALGSRERRYDGFK